MPQNFICIVLPCAALLKLHGDLGGRVGPKFGDLMATGHQTWQWKSPINGGLNGKMIYIIYIIYIYNIYNIYIIYTVYIYGNNVFHLPHPMFSSILYVHVSEMLCTCQRCYARFPAVVHVSQKLCTCHKPPNNVRVQPLSAFSLAKALGRPNTFYRYTCIYIYGFV